MNDHGRPTPHTIGNNGEAPVDYPPTLDAELQQLAWAVDSCISDRLQLDECRRLTHVACRLEALSNEVFECCKRNGVVI